MTALALDPVTGVRGTNSGWGRFYRVGGVAALVVLLAGLSDVLIAFLPGAGGTGTAPGALTVIDWFTLFADKPLLGLRNLGVLNMVTMTSMILVGMAIYAAHRPRQQAAAALGMILLCMGTTIYVANNTALPMLTLSHQYAAAGEAQRSLIVAAGTGLLVREDLTAGAYMGFLFGEAGGILLSLVMLKGKLFSKRSAIAGMLAEGCLVIFNFFAAFLPETYGVTVMLGMVGGLLALAWMAMVAGKLFRLARATADEA
ncbi:MAG TPA: hypothetical protein VGA61_03720 [Anaerolineae bacterium]